MIDFFLSETAHHADVVLAGSLHEEEDGLGCSAEGRVIHWQKAVDPPGEARRRFANHHRSGSPSGPRAVLSVQESRRHS